MVSRLRAWSLALRVFVPDDQKQSLRLTSLVSRRVVTDKEGRFVLAMPPEAMPDLLLYVTGSLGAEISPESRRMAWTGESQADVIIRLRF